MVTVIERRTRLATRRASRGTVQQNALNSRRRVLQIAAAGLAGLTGTRLATAEPWWFDPVRPMHLATRYSPLRSIFGMRDWLSSDPLAPADIQGKVVLVNFWTYSCINSLRMLPYTRAWHQKYKDHGLLLIGVHTPEFEFEKTPVHVREAVASLGVHYPVVLDNDYDIWQSFENVAWPALYFIGGDGRVRRRALGEGDYAQSEALLQKLLLEIKGDAGVPMGTVDAHGTGPQAPPSIADLRSPETYTGYAKATNFVSPGGIIKDASSDYRPRSQLALNHWDLEGRWTIRHEFASLDDARGKVRFRSHARDLHLVMGRASPKPIAFRVTIDGAAPDASHGSDIGPDGAGRVLEDRMYQLVRQAGPVADRTVEIEFADPGVRAYVFTFG